MTITNGYATLDQFNRKAGIKVDKQKLKQEFIEESIEQGSREIDAITGRIFYLKDSETYKVRYNILDNNLIKMDYNELENRTTIYFPAKVKTVTSVTDSGEVLVENTDFIKVKNKLIFYGLLSTDIMDPVEIVAVIGEDTVPADITKLCIEYTEIYTGLSTYYMTDPLTGDKIEITRNNLPEYLKEKLKGYVRCHLG